MNFLDGHLYPENQQPLIITAAPYAPGWIPSDFPEDIPVTMEEQIQKAVDCYEAGATVLHLHVREADGKGSKRLSMFNELIAGVRGATAGLMAEVVEDHVRTHLVDETAHPGALKHEAAEQLLDVVRTYLK